MNRNSCSISIATPRSEVLTLSCTSPFLLSGVVIAPAHVHPHSLSPSPRSPRSLRIRPWHHPRGHQCADISKGAADVTAAYESACSVYHLQQPRCSAHSGTRIIDVTNGLLKAVAPLQLTREDDGGMLQASRMWRRDLATIRFAWLVFPRSIFTCYSLSSHC